jgi:hypothetical protein
MPLPTHIALMADPANWLDNPLARREARRDRKRRQPFKAYAWMLGTMSVPFGAMLWLIGRLHDSGGGVPWYLGGAAGTALCVSVCGIHSWFISAAMRKHTATLIWQEASRNTLPGLLTLPAPPFQLLFQTALYPWIAAMRLALAGLPFYLFAFAAGGLTARDLLMLYIVFSLTSLGFAGWNRPILTGSPTLVLPVAAGSQTPGAQQNAATAQTGQAGGQQAVGWAFLVPVFVMAFVMPALMTGGTRGLYSNLRQYAPDSVLQLLPTFLFSWPLLVARSLVTAFDWFGWHVLPLPFVLLFTLAGRYLNLVKSSEFLSVGTYRDLATQPTYAARRVWEQRYRFALLFVVTGYLWKWAIVNGALAFLASRGSKGPPAPLAAFAFALLFVTIWRWLGRVRALAGWQHASGRKPKTPPLVIPRVRARSAALYVLSLPLAAGAYYLACCLLSRTPPFPPDVAALAGKMAAIAIAAAILQYAMIRATGVLPVLPGMILVALVAFGPPESRPLMVLSPALGMLALGPPSALGLVRFGAAPPPGLVALFATPSPWWTWPLACGAAGAIAAVWIPVRKTFRAAENVVTQVPAPTAVAVDPAAVGPEVYYDALFEKKDTDAKSETPAGLRLLNAATRLSDNAVAIKEMRARLRGRLSPALIRGSAFGFGIITILLLGSPRFTLGLGGGLAQLLYGPLRGATAQTAASMLSIYYLLMAWFAVSAGLGIMPQAFAPEREKSTLGFLLMTPMRTRSIVAGKTLGLLCGASTSVLLLAFATLALTLLFSPAIGPLVALSVWARAVTVALTLMASMGFLAVGIAALFPRSINQAGCGGALVGLLIQVPIQLLIHLGRVLGPMSGASSGGSILDSGLFWASVMGGAGAVALLGFGAAMFGVWRLRRRDIAFEGSRQEN